MRPLGSYFGKRREIWQQAVSEAARQYCSGPMSGLGLVGMNIIFDWSRPRIQKLARKIYYQLLTATKSSQSIPGT